MTVNRYSTWIGLARRPGDYSAEEEQITWPDATEIDLTAERCRYVGSEPIRAGTEWTVRLSLYRGDEDGTLSNLGLRFDDGGTSSIHLHLWDPSSKVAACAAIAADIDPPSGGVRKNTATLTIPDTLAPGRYECALTVTWPETTTWTHCRGTIDVLPPVPA